MADGHFCKDLGSDASCDRSSNVSFRSLFLIDVFKAPFLSGCAVGSWSVELMLMRAEINTRHVTIGI
jgi:hypothetical protein